MVTGNRSIDAMGPSVCAGGPFFVNIVHDFEKLAR